MAGHGGDRGGAVNEHVGMSATPPRPSLSIVIGARSEDDPTECLRSLAKQIDDGVEVILVSDGARDGAPLPWVAELVRPGGLVPELWAAGIEEASGRLIGLLTAGSVPERGWVTLTRKAHAEGGASIVGGAIEPGPQFTFTDWAVFFCRYSPYMRPISATSALEVPGDNASYDGDVVRGYRTHFEDGFWEPFVHAALRADGHTQAFCPQRGVRIAFGASASGFRRQRFSHGQAHGRSRSSAAPRWRTALGVFTTPLVPLVMTARAARTVATKRRHLGRFLMVTPLVLWFYAWWAAGEMVGRLQMLSGRSGT